VSALQSGEHLSAKELAHHAHGKEKRLASRRPSRAVFGQAAALTMA
jgi:hypothetical protein